MDYLEIIGTLVGLVYLWLEYKASIYLWAAGIVMPAIYIFVYYNAGLYADVGINIYYLLAAVYGWVIWQYGAYWKRKRKQKATGEQADSEVKELPIRKAPMRYWLPLTAINFILFLAIGWILIRYTDSNVPWLDSFTTALSIIALWMLARKYIEQWLVWIVVDITCCGLYIYKELYFTAGLYGLYSVIAVLGYFKWKELMYAQR